MDVARASGGGTAAVPVPLRVGVALIVDAKGPPGACLAGWVWRPGRAATPLGRVTVDAEGHETSPVRWKVDAAPVSVVVTDSATAPADTLRCDPPHCAIVTYE